MTCAALHFKEQGVTHFIFGDIYLHDVRAYRERQLAPLGIEVVEPLWGVVSSEIVMQQYLASGLKTVIVTTQADGLGMDAIGREVDADLIASLPQGNGSQRRKRRIPHVLLRRTDILLTRTFPTGNSL